MKKLTITQLRSLIRESAGVDTTSMNSLLKEMRTLIERMDDASGTTSNDVNVALDKLHRAYIDLKLAVHREEKSVAVNKSQQKQKGHYLGSRFVPEE